MALKSLNRKEYFDLPSKGAHGQFRKESLILDQFEHITDWTGDGQSMNGLCKCNLKEVTSSIEYSAEE